MLCGHYSKSVTDNQTSSSDSTQGRVVLDWTGQDFPITMDCLEDDFDCTRNVFMLPLFRSKAGNVYEVSNVEDNDNAEEIYVCDLGKSWLPRLIVVGIVLQQISVTKGHFRRVGAFELYHKNFAGSSTEYERYYDTFLQAMEKVGTLTAESECIEVVSRTESSGSQYMIVIE
jgi:hypothetical protein